MFEFFKSIQVYIKVYSDKVEITRLDTDKTVSRTAKDKFSNQRLVIANYQNAQILIRSVLQELIGKPFFSPALSIVIQQMVKLEGGLSEVEWRTLLDVAEHAGGRYVKVVMHTTELTRSQVLLEMNSK